MSSTPYFRIAMRSTPMPKAKPLTFFGIVIDESVHIRIDHAAAQQFNPSAGLAVAARATVAISVATAENATDLHIGAGLGEREERRIEARLHARSEQRFHGVIERALQIAERDVRIDRQPFDLMKDRGVRGIGRVVAMNFSRDKPRAPAASSSPWCESAPAKYACAAADDRAAASIPAWR